MQTSNWFPSPHDEFVVGVFCLELEIVKRPFDMAVAPQKAKAPTNSFFTSREMPSNARGRFARAQTVGSFTMQLQRRGNSRASGLYDDENESRLLFESRIASGSAITSYFDPRSVSLSQSQPQSGARVSSS